MAYAVRYYDAARLLKRELLMLVGRERPQVPTIAEARTPEIRVIGSGNKSRHVVWAKRAEKRQFRSIVFTLV